ncbi:bacteriocin [Lactobacillus sp. ESL0245]|nr:bacteriocin [Lactobacillus sp. ESL0247]RMC28811.1 bacteriocin [Lactobacillus sp. ESL0246]RMC31895.1 bacteriocin [Lactobacillus sp. ESL0245]RMC49152.1 bacteriocin [Lactobacillus sp. ESL0228]
MNYSEINKTELSSIIGRNK